METWISDENAPVQVRLEDFRGGWTCIAFFPPGMASHPELARFEELRRDFAAQGCLVLAASIDSWWDLREARASFPLVADTQADLARSFGFLADGHALFGWLLLDPDGTLRDVEFEHGPCARCALQSLRALRSSPSLRLVS